MCCLIVSTDNCCNEPFPWVCFLGVEHDYVLIKSNGCWVCGTRLYTQEKQKEQPLK